jgi:hypothetical protein
MKEIKEILIMGVRKIHSKAQQNGGELGMDDLKRLESLTRSWKSYFGAEIDAAKDDLESMSLEELFELAKEK